MNEIKEELNKWGDIPCSWTERLSIVEMSVLPNLIYRFVAIPMKISASYFVDIDNLILKCGWRGKKSRIANVMLKENKVKDSHNLTWKLNVKLQ